MITLPKTYDLGFGPLVDLSYLETAFSIPRASALRVLRALHIEPVFMGQMTLFSLVTFQRLLFVLTRPGGPGFIFPGSKGKRRSYLRGGALEEITDEMVKQAQDPAILSEMAACAGTDKMLLRKFVDGPKNER